MKLVEQMRVFESDHEPDGWPAIQMKQVSALCDEIERLQTDSELLKQRSESPRITEQDAREILEGFCKIWHYSSEIGAFLGDSDCRDILAKLNEANHEKAN